MDPGRTDNGRLAPSLETSLVIHTAQGPGLRPCAVDNNADRFGLGPDPQAGLGDVGQLAVLNVSAGTLELV